MKKALKQRKNMDILRKNFLNKPSKTKKTS